MFTRTDTLPTETPELAELEFAVRSDADAGTARAIFVVRDADGPIDVHAFDLSQN